MFQFKLIKQLTITTVLGLVLAGVASAANWADCGGDTCINPNVGVSMVTKLGKSDGTSSYVHMIYDGVTSTVTCMAFDTKPGTGKICSRTDNAPNNVGFNTHVKFKNTSGGLILGIPTANINCSEGAACNLQNLIPNYNGEPYWVRYGSTTKSTTAIASGTFTCNSSYFGVDPHPGTAKTCAFDSPVFQKISGMFDINAAGTWIDCATQGSNCNIGTDDTVVVRYGDKNTNRFIYRILSNAKSGSTTAPVPCDHGDNKLIQNGYNPAPNVQKTCSYVRLHVGDANHDGIGAPTGEWQKIISHGCSVAGGSCSASLTYNYGASESSQKQETNEWGMSLTYSITTGIEGGITGITALSSISTAFDYSKSSSFTQSRDANIQTSQQITCSTPPTPSTIGTLDVYQYVISSNAACLTGGGCGGKVFELSTACAYGEPDSYKGPRCLPNDFADKIKDPLGIACKSRNEYMLEVITAGSGQVTSSVRFCSSSSSCAITPIQNIPSVYKTAIVKGSSVTLTATPNAGTVFTGWSGGACNGSTNLTCTVTNSSENTVSVTANFGQPVSVTTVNVVGNGSVSSSPVGINNCGMSQTCSSPFTQGSSVTLTAVPNSGANFQSWTNGPCAGSLSATCTFTVPATAVNTTANFASPTSRLTVTVNGTNGGTVSTSPEGINNCSATNTTACRVDFPQNIDVVLYAVPASGRTFLGWTAGPCMIDPARSSCSFKTQSASYSAIANFSSSTILSNDGGNDFVISNVKLSTLAPLKGDTFSATVTVKNWSSSAQNGGKLRIWSNLTNAPTSLSLGEFKTVDVGVLAAGQRKNFIISGLAAHTKGVKKLWALVDANNVISETNENNNVFGVKYRVK